MKLEEKTTPKCDGAWLVKVMHENRKGKLGSEKMELRREEKIN